MEPEVFARFVGDLFRQIRLKTLMTREKSEVQLDLSNVQSGRNSILLELLLTNLALLSSSIDDEKSFVVPPSIIAQGQFVDSGVVRVDSDGKKKSQYLEKGTLRIPIKKGRTWEKI